MVIDMKITDEIIIENDLYIVVDTHIYNKEKYYILSNGNKYILAKEKEEKIEYIKDEEKINEVLGDIGFNVSGILFDKLKDIKFKALMSLRNVKIERKLTEEENNKVIDIYITFLKKIKEKEKNLNIDIDKIIKRIKNVDKYICDTKNLGGFYYPETDCVCFDKKYMDNPHCIIHELIHASGLFNKDDLLVNLWFIEGATELTAAKISNSYISKAEWPYTYLLPKGVFAYTSTVCLVQQLEYILNKSCSSIINGDYSFLNEFEGKVGKKFYILFKHFANYTVNGHYDYKIFEILQNKLLTKIFDKEFEEAHDIKDFEKYINRLLNFSLYRGIKDNEDIFFEQYYLDKLEKIKEQLIKKGYKKEEINKFLNNLDNYTNDNNDKRIQNFIEKIDNYISVDNKLPLEVFYLREKQFNEYIFVENEYHIVSLYNKKINYVKAISEFRYKVYDNYVEIILEDNQKLTLNRVNPNLIQNIQYNKSSNEIENNNKVGFSF